MSLLYTAVRGMLRLGLRAYFRRVEMHGKENIPPEGPLVILANHHNSMIDPFLLIAAAERPVSFIAKAPLFKIPLLRLFLWGLRCIPAYRTQDAGYVKEKNQALYDAAADFLEKGYAVGLFPEGCSHTDPRLLEFKHGASRIAFEAAGRGVPVRVLLMGLHFERSLGFRGRVLVQAGPSITLDEYKARYAADPREATAALTEALHARMSEMVLNAESREQMKLADLVEHMGVLDEEGGPGLKGEFDKKKRLLEGYAWLKEHHPAEVAGVREDLEGYQEFLKALGVRDDQVVADYRPGRVAGYALRNTLLLVLGLPIVAAGLIGNFVPYLVSHLLGRIPKDVDVKTSIALMVGLFAFPLWWAALAVGAWLAMGLWGAVGAAVLAPLAGAITLRWMDHWHRVLRETWGLWTAMALPSARAKLRRMRSRILARLQRLIERMRPAPPAA